MAHAMVVIEGFLVLSSHHSGSRGTLQINHLCEKILRYQKKDDIERPIFKKLLMVRRNDYKWLLFNGDTRVVIEENRRSWAWIAAKQSGPKLISLSGLPRM